MVELQETMSAPAAVSERRRFHVRIVGANVSLFSVPVAGLTDLLQFLDGVVRDLNGNAGNAGDEEDGPAIALIGIGEGSYQPEFAVAESSRFSW